MILYVVRYWPTLTETFVRDEAAALAAQGHDVRVAALGARGDPHCAPDPVPVRIRPTRWGWVRALPMLIAEWVRAPGWVPPRVLWLASLVRGGRHVHAHFAGESAAAAAAACARVGVPWSVTVHAVDLYKPRPDLVPLLRRAAFVATVSEANRRTLADLGVSAHLVRCGVPSSLLGQPDTDPTAGGAPVDVLAVGRWVPKKGWDVLLAAAVRLPEVRFRLVTDAPRGLVVPPNVELVGLRPRAEVLQAMSGARLFCLPCRVAPDGDRDGVPVVLLESMALGVPVVTTPVSGIPELVDADVGWLVPPDAPEALASTVRAALADPPGIASRGRAARDRIRARGLTVEAQAAEVLRLIDAHAR